MIQVYTQNTNDIWFAIACFERQIIATSFADLEQKALSHLLNNIPLNTPFQVLPAPPSTCAKTAFALMTDVFEGKDVYNNFDLATDKLSRYTARVLDAVAQVPTGYVSTYGAVAKAVGGGPRAVGNVMAGNIFVLLVPCHRIVKSDFSLGGYGGGLKIKYQLLVKEQRGYLESKKVVTKNGGVLPVYPVEVTLKNILSL